MTIFKFKSKQGKTMSDDNLEETFVENENSVETAENTTDNDPIKTLQDEVASWKDKAHRLAADMDNLRKRSQRDQEDAVKYGLTNAARQFLNVADNLERALAAVTTPRAELPDAVQSLLSGIEATQTDLLGALGKLGVTPIAVKAGDALDPQVHEVMFDAPSQDHAPGTILYVMETGYKLHERLLRPARVAVAKAATGTPDKAMDVSV